MTVPAKPQSIAASTFKLAGVTVGEVVLLPVTVEPSDSKAAIMRLLSLETKAPAKVVGSVASAAKTSSRLVSDLDPGSGTVAPSGSDATGAAQRE